MPDDLLLTLLWLLPALGALLVVFLPRQAETAIKGVSLAVTVLTFLLTLMAYFTYVAPDERASAPLAERAANNILTQPEEGETLPQSEEGEKGAYDLMVLAVALVGLFVGVFAWIQG